MSPTCQLHATTPLCSSELLVALELSSKTWLVGSTVGLGGSLRRKTLKAGDVLGLRRELALAKIKFKLPRDAQVVCVQEAGRDGFWIHRALESFGVRSLVVDPASIEVDRRQRRAKTDRLDVAKLLKLLARKRLGEAAALREVHVPTPEEEDRRQLHRELETLKQERREHAVRMQSLLATLGLKMPLLNRCFPQRLAELKQWNGEPVPPGLRDRLLREFARWQLVCAQIAALNRQREDRIGQEQSPEMERVRLLLDLHGIGKEGAWVLMHEMFAWRQLRNRREVAALAGLAPTPYASGNREREQGISKAGNRRVRTLVLELAWLWVRHQPHSPITRWYEQRFKAGQRSRKVGIVAVARKLLITLWRFVTYGEVPEGAVLVDWRGKIPQRSWRPAPT